MHCRSLQHFVLLLAGTLASAAPEHCSDDILTGDDACYGHGAANMEADVPALLQLPRDDLKPQGPLTPHGLERLGIKPPLCIYRNFKTPCFHLQFEKLLLANGTAVPHKYRLNLVAEVSLPTLGGEFPQNYSLPGSLHEFAADPRSRQRFFLTRQVPPVVTLLEYPKTMHYGKESGWIIDGDFNLESTIIGEHVGPKVLAKLRAQGMTRRALRESGLHAMRVLDDTGDGHMAYLTLQFIDAIGVMDVSSMTLVDIIFFPCKRFGLEEQPEMDAHPYGLLDAKDCAGPHTMTLDSQGHLYATLKTAGGIGVLRNPATGEDRWHYYPIAGPSKPVPFYISRSVSQTGLEYIYFNDIANSYAGIFNVTGLEFPPPDQHLVNLTATISFSPEKGPVGPRPGGIVGLRDGAALFASYNLLGVLLYVSPRGKVEPMYLQDKSGAGDKLAYLHICSSPSVVSSSKIDLAVLASSNDFPYMLESPVPFNPDVVRQIRNIDPVAIAAQRCSLAKTHKQCSRRGPNCRWKTQTMSCFTVIRTDDFATFTASTQNSWLHRVNCIPPPSRVIVHNQPALTPWVIFATELHTDRLLVTESAVVDEEDIDMVTLDQGKRLPEGIQ